MFLQLPAFAHRTRGSAAAAITMTFLLGLGVGAWLGPALSRQTSARAATDPAATVSAERPAARRTSYPTQVLRVIDGDTFEARVSVWPGLDITTKVRLRGIDAPELRAHCAEELKQAQAARDALTTILKEGRVGIAPIGLDKAGGRVLAEASTGGTPDISAALLQAGLVRRYHGGKRESWCNNTAASSQ